MLTGVFVLNIIWTSWVGVQGLRKRQRAHANVKSLPAAHHGTRHWNTAVGSLARRSGDWRAARHGKLEGKSNPFPSKT
ncbi:hypothetical protein ACLOJK_018189 [Asimina triloba]